MNTTPDTDTQDTTMATNTRTRDYQRIKVYRAQWDTDDWYRNTCDTLELERTSKNPLTDAQWFVRTISDWAGFRAITPRIQNRCAQSPHIRHRIVVEVNPKQRNTSYGGGKWVQTRARGGDVLRPAITMAPSHLMLKQMLIHECAHWVGENVRHGPVFAAAFHELTAKFIGPEYADELVANYERHGVDHYWS